MRYLFTSTGCRNKGIFFLITIMIILVSSCQQKTDEVVRTDYPVVPVEFTQVKVEGPFWLNRINTNRKVTIPFDFNKCEETSRIDNFAVAAGIKSGKFVGFRYNDSDLFKVMEGASFSLHTYPDAQLEHYLDSIIGLVAQAQEADGYLYTCRTIDSVNLPKGAGDKRWSNLKNSHELYNIGHMYEAAVAHYLATGKRNFLDVAIKSADLVCKTFGPGDHQLHEVTGHQEIEIGLVKLYRVTKDEKYLDMAKYFLDQRGRSENHQLYTYGEDGSIKDYTQDHLPVVEQREAVGHAVRAAYMYSGMADVAALTQDDDFKKALDNLWENVVGKKLYITGGIGSVYNGEAFGSNYELPNLTAYCETCAAIANMLWNQRMFLLYGDGKYIDVLERTLYNNFLAGVSMDGNEFFYPNPLESDGSHARSPWFSCACCPTNVVRFMPSLPGYIYATNEDEVYVNLYIASSTQLNMPFGNLTLKQSSDYPWQGDINIQVEKLDEPASFNIKLRIPGWAVNEAIPSDLYSFIEPNTDQVTMEVNGEPVQLSIEKGYATLTRTWQKGDEIHLHLPMPVRKVIAHDSVESDRGKMAIQRGPLVFAAEGVDNGGSVRNLLFDPNVSFDSKFNKGLLGGVEQITANADAVSLDKNGKLVRKPMEVSFIPYYAWAHRGTTEMVVWLPYVEEAASPTPPATIASTSKVSASFVHDTPKALNDQVVPANSNDHGIPRFTFWNHKGTDEWVMYEFSQPQNISRTAVYWFDDGPDGGCRIPKSWKLLYKDITTKKWKEVTIYNDYPLKKDDYNSITYMPVTTQAVKLKIQLQDNYSGGILEWKIQ